MRRFYIGSLAVALVLAVSASAGAREASAPGPDQRAATSKGANQTARYKGKSKNGQKIRFKVVTRDGRSRVKGLSVDVVTECWADLDHDGVQDKVVAHIRNLAGKVSRAGEVEVYFAPDDDTEYVVEGKLTDRRARLNVIVGGRFSPEGVPNGGDLDCDNWGTIYKAKRRS